MSKQSHATSNIERDNVPLIAILRGVTPKHILEVADIIVKEGFTSIEVPLNSPNALESIALLVKEYGDKYLIGAGTVTTPALAKDVIATGANLIVTPNLNKKVVKLAVKANCHCYPGIVSPTEAFKALEYGATGLKLFPISMLGMNGFKALKSVLPADAECYPVGGIDPTAQSMYPYLDAGAVGFGLGSSLYKPSMTMQEIQKNAESFIHLYKQYSLTR